MDAGIVKPANIIVKLTVYYCENNRPGKEECKSMLGYKKMTLNPPVKSAVGSLPNAGVVPTVGGRPHVVDHAHQLVLHGDVVYGSPPENKHKNLQ